MPDSTSSLLRFSAVAFVLWSASCGPGLDRPVTQRPQRQLSGWNDDGGPGKVSIRISLPDQIAEIERDGRGIGWCYVATGKEGHGTKPGTYRITEKIVDKYSNRYGWIEDEFGNVVDGDAKHNDPVGEGMVYVPAPMPYWMRLTSHGIGMHGGLIPEPGKPASHGCIRLPKDFVPVLFDMVEVGTPVTITSARSQRAPTIENPVPRALDANRRVIATRPLRPSDLQRRAPLRAERLTNPYSAF